MKGSGIQEKRSGGLKQGSREDHSIDRRDQEGEIKEKGKGTEWEREGIWEKQKGKREESREEEKEGKGEGARVEPKRGFSLLG